MPDTSALGVTAVDARRAPAAVEVQEGAQEQPQASGTEGSSSGTDTTGADGVGEQGPDVPAAVESPAAPTPAAAPGGGRSRALRPLEPVSVELLLAKTYSSWRGHDNDAIATCVRACVRACVCCRRAQGVRANERRAMVTMCTIYKHNSDVVPNQQMPCADRGGMCLQRCMLNTILLLLCVHIRPVRSYDALINRFPEDFRCYLAKGVFLRDKGRRADAERMFLQVCGWRMLMPACHFGCKPWLGHNSISPVP